MFHLLQKTTRNTTGKENNTIGFSIYKVSLLLQIIPVIQINIHNEYSTETEYMFIWWLGHFKISAHCHYYHHLTFLAHLSRRLKWAFLIKICPLSVVVVVVVVVNFSHFHLLLQNHWANFNQTCHKASLGEGDSSLFKWRAPPFSKGR